MSSTFPRKRCPCSFCNGTIAIDNPFLTLTSIFSVGIFFIILDEAQNTTYVQMKMFLTRMGRNAKFIITGDPGQVDLPKKVNSGLSEALHIIKEIKGIGTLFLDDKDVVRHPLVKEIINAYSRAEKEED